MVDEQEALFRKGDKQEANEEEEDEEEDDMEEDDEGQAGRTGGAIGGDPIPMGHGRR
jgi:hypothetical protein